MKETKSVLISRTCDWCGFTEKAPCSLIKEFLFAVIDFDGHRNDETIKSMHLCNRCQSDVYFAIKEWGGLGEKKQ